MVHQQQIRPPFGGELYRRLTEIDRRRDPRDLPLVRHLQAVQRVRGVRDVSDLQILV
jgi:hypothetical protein